MKSNEYGTSARKKRKAMCSSEDMERNRPRNPILT